MSLNISIIIESFFLYVENLSFIKCVQLFVALLGLIQILKSICTFLKAFYSKLYNHGLLKQERFLYHFSMYKNNVEFREYKLKFDKNWKNKIIIKVTDLSINRHDYLKYDGCVKKEGNQVIFKLETEDKNLFSEPDRGKEEVQIRFYNSSLFTEKIVYGLWMGKDLNNRPICGVRIMSSEKLTESQVKEFIINNAITDNVFGMLSIKNIDYVNNQTSTNQKSDIPFIKHKDGEYYSGIGVCPLSVDKSTEKAVSFEGKMQ